jgi:MoaA/NifB/PqqE/SkfB family radical SAM enzyme
MKKENTLKGKSLKLKKSEYILNLDRCNQHCLFCLKREDIANYRNITKETAIGEIALAKKNGYTEIYFFGGEPTVFNFLSDVIAYAMKLGLRTFLATNATRFASLPYTRSFFKKISQAPLEVRVSLHSHLPEVHDKITQVPGSHTRAILGITHLMRYTKPAITVVVTSLNYKDLEKIVEDLYVRGVRTIKFAFLVMTGEILNNKWLMIEPVDYIQPLLRAVILAKKRNFIFIGVENFPPTLFKAMQKAKIPVTFNENEYDKVLNEMKKKRKKIFKQLI